MSTFELSGHRVIEARIYLPAWGVWYADVCTDVSEVLSGSQVLVAADARFVGAVMSGGTHNGRTRYRLAGGAGGWGRVVAAKSYTNDAGVKRSTVLLDAAAAAGETLVASTIPAGSVGPAWVRERGPAARVLQQIAPESWYVDETGSTRIGRRSASTFAGEYTHAEADYARGMVELAADSIAGLVPGVVVEGIAAVDVIHDIVPGRLRTCLWGASVAPTSRRLAAMRRLFDQLQPAARYRGLWEYRVVSQEGERLNLQPVRVSTGMPDLRRVPVRPGVPGARADFDPNALGSTVLVGFVDADPARPVVLSFEDAESSGFAPAHLDFGPSPRLGVARLGDAVVAGPFGGTITVASTRVRAGT